MKLLIKCLQVWVILFFIFSEYLSLAHSEKCKNTFTFASYVDQLDARAVLFDSNGNANSQWVG